MHSRNSKGLSMARVQFKERQEQMRWERQAGARPHLSFKPIVRGLGF